ncbi:hypothetical protein [Streptomyces sp. Rer75]|nr:hypothetical protein [Streptomyces sp. Rer75]
MELQIALRTLLERLPGLRLADADVEWKVGVSTRGVRRLPVTWSA